MASTKLLRENLHCCGCSRGSTVSLCMQTIDGLEADVAQGKKDTSTQIESASEAGKALAAAERRLESAAAVKTDLEQRIAELKQQLAPFEGRVQAAIAETKVQNLPSPQEKPGPCMLLLSLCLL